MLVRPYEINRRFYSAPTGGLRNYMAQRVLHSIRSFVGVAADGGSPFNSPMLIRAYDLWLRLNTLQICYCQPALSINLTASAFNSPSLSSSMVSALKSPHEFKMSPIFTSSRTGYS